MDIPLPGEPVPQLAKHSTEPGSVEISSPHNIPLPSPRSILLPSQSKVEEIQNLCSSPPPLPPGSADGEDSNRYSPSRVTGDDDTGKDDQHDQESSQHQGSPLALSTLGSKGTRTTVLGKVQAKKRLLAFSMTKQGGGQGLSFGFNRKAPNKMSTGSMPFAGTGNDEDAGDKEKDEKLPSPKKKGLGKKGISRDDKARAVVSAIEEIKREEMLMRGVLGYNTQIGSTQMLGDQTYPLPLMTASVLPPAKPRDELEMSNILSEQQKGTIEKLLGSLLTHDSEKKSKEEEKERKRSEEKRKRDSEKSSHHSKERHRSSKERHSRSGREREKEEKKHRPSELPKSWQQFRDRGFKFEEIRRLKLKLEKDKLASNNREKIRKSRDREHRSRSHEKRHKSPSQSEDKDKTTESDYDIMSKPFETTSRPIYPFRAVGVRQMQKQYPRSLIRFTKFRPSIPYCENPATSKAFYRTREEILCEASQRIVDLMHCVINGDLCKINSKTEKNFKTKQTTDTNLSNSLAALQVSYDETEIDENMSSSDDTSGTRRERPWFLPENLVVWPDGEEVCPTTCSDVELNVKWERSDETDADSYKKKKDSSVESSEVKENDMPNYLNNERERDVRSSEPEIKGSLRSERTTVRSKWDSDYEDDRMQDDSTIQNSHIQSPQLVNDDAEKWEEKDSETNFIEISSKDELPAENQEKSDSESDNSSESSSESSSGIESNSEDSSTVAKDNHVQKDKETEYKQNHKNGREIDEETVPKSGKYTSELTQECSANNVHPENSGDGNTNLKLASEYEEFMKAVSFESSAMEDGDAEIPPSELLVKGALKRVGTPEAPAQERRERRISANSEASHDKLDIEPARIEETQSLKKLSETKLPNKPKLMTSSASEDELMPAEKEEKQETKARELDIVEQNNSHPRKERKQRTSSSDSSSSSESSVESEEVKEKRKSKSKKASKKKRKKVVHNKKKQRKASKKKRARSSSSSESDSSSNADSSSSSSSEDNRKKQKHKEKIRRRAKSSSSEGSDSSSENVSSDDRSARKKKKKKKAKRVPKKKSSKKRKRSRKESESSDSEDNVRSRRSKSTRHKKKDLSKENNIEHYSSDDEKASEYEETNSTSHRKDSDVHTDHNKKASGKSKGGSHERETSQKRNSKKYSKDNSSVDENYCEEREKKSSSRKKTSSSYKKSSHYHASESSDDEADRKNIKKRRRERRSCTTSPVVSSNKKRRRSPSTSPEHSPTPQRRNSTEGKTISQRERSKEQSSSRKLKHSSGSKKGHKQKDLEVSEHTEDFSEDCSFKRSEDRRFRNSKVHERNDWEDNSSNEDSCDGHSKSREEENSDAEDVYHRISPRKTVYQEDYPVQLLRSEDIKKEVFSEEEEENFMGKETIEEKVNKNVGKHAQMCVSDDETEDDHDFQKQSRSSSSGKSESSNLKSFGDKYSFVQVKIEPEDVPSETEKDIHNSEVPLLYSPDPPEVETPKSHLSHSQSVSGREVCSTDSSQFSHVPDKVMDRYGSDLSQESFKDTSEANFTGKLFRKQNYSLSEESFRPGSRNPETPRIVRARGTNFTLDNIPLPPISTNREDAVCVSPLEDVSNSTRNKQINNTLSEKLPNLPVPELSGLPGNSNKQESQRQVISFKLLSPSYLLQSSQTLVDSSNNLDDGNSNLSEKQHVIQVVENVSKENSEPNRKIESETDKRSVSSILETSRDEWLTNLRNVEHLATSSITTETTNSEVTSSSKIPVVTEPSSSNSDTQPKERQRKRPSRWGMTTVPPKKKAIEELYESLPLASKESDALSQTGNEKIFYDKYISSNIERKENIPSKEVQGILVDPAVKNSSDTLNEISEKKELVKRTESGNFSEWELPESIEDQNVGWEASREKDASHKNRYIHELWHGRRVRRDKFTTEKVEKNRSEGCGSLIDWENDLEQSKATKARPTTEKVNVFHYSQEPEICQNSSQTRSRLEKENICEDESGSEWESREVTYHSKSSAFRTCEVKPDAKEKNIRERQDSLEEKSSQRHIDFTDDRSWDERKWHNEDVNASKREEKRHRDEIHDIRRDEHDLRKEMRDTKRLEEGSMDDVYRDVRGIDDSDALADNKEKERIDESQAPQDDYSFEEKYTEGRREERDSNELVVQTTSHIKLNEDRKVSVLLSGELPKSDKTEDQHRKDEKGRVSRERRDGGDQGGEDVRDKNRKDYPERIKREVDEREQRDEDRARKSCGERERERREVDDDQRREDRNRKDYCEGERITIRDKERRESEMRDSRHDEESARKDYTERERSSARERERRDTRDRREERRRERERDRRSDRRERGRWEREKRDRHREERENNQRNRSPTDYHHDRDRRESHRDDREHSHSPPPDYWQGEWDRDPKERDCDCTGNYYLRDIPLPINSTMGGPSTWPSGAVGEADMELSCSPASSPLVGFKRSLADSTISDSELVSCKQEDMSHRPREMSPSSTVYPPGIVSGKSYERKQPYLKQQVVASSPSSDRPPTPTDSPAFSPKRLSLDDRIEIELGVKNTPPSLSAPQYQVYQHQQPPPCPQQQQAPLQQQIPSTQSQQQSTFPYAQYYAHVPPPTQFEPRSDKFLSMPPPPYGQPVDDYGPPQHMYPPPPVKPGLMQMPPPSLDAPQKRRPPLLPTPNIRPLTNWDSPEAFIGAQPPQSSRVVQVGNVLQVVPVEVPPPAVPGPQSSSQSMVLQTGNVLQVIPSDALPNTVPPVSCSEPPPVTNSSSQVVQVGNVLQVIPGPTTPTRSVTIPVATPPKATFPPTSTHSAAQGLSPHIPPLHLPPMHGPPPSQASTLLPSPTRGPPPNHPPPLHGPLTHPPPPHGIPTHPPPSHCPPPHTPPIRGPPIHTPPIQVSSVHGLSGHAPSPSQGVPLLTSPSLEMSPSPAITSPLVSSHGPVPPPVTGVQVTASVATNPIPSIPTSGATVISSVSSATSVIPPSIVPTPVAAPISYSPPASPFLVPPVIHAPMVPVGLSEGTPVVASQGDCPIPFLSSVEMAQASQMEEAERRRTERARRRAEKEKRRKEKEKRHQNKIKQATEMIIKKALEQEGEMLSTASDIDLEEMRLIEEAMQQVPEPEEEEEEMPQTDADQQLRKRKRKTSIDIQVLPPAGKGILVSPGFREKPLGGGGIERKSVKFADGVRPGEGTSPSAGEDLPSPPPPPRKLPKEKRYKKKKKKKIKVKIIRQINVEDEDDDDEDISPPPPPPGSPPPPPMYPPGAHYPPTYPSGFTYSTAPPFTVLPGVDSSAATGTSGNLFTPLYHQHHHTTTTTHTTTVQFAPPPPPVTPVPPPPPNPHMFKRESKSNP